MSSALEQEYKKISIKFSRVSLREQLLILFCGLIVVIWMLHTFLLAPVLNSTEKLQQNSVNAQNELVSFTEQVTELSNQLNVDPNQPVREKIEALKRKIHSINTQLETQTNDLVPANKMAQLLESVLADSTGLALIELQSIAPTSLLLDQTEQDRELNAGLYRHGVTLVFEGSYFDIQQYLEKLERLPWHFYWQKFDYLVGDYPKARVELEIYTLSTNKAFIGV